MGSTASPSLGLMATNPSLLDSQETTMSPNARSAKRVAGCGRALPMRSIADKKRERIELRF